MKAIWNSFFRMIAAMRRDKMLFMACLGPVLAGFFFRFAIPFLEALLRDCFSMPEVITPYYRLIDVFFAMLSPAMFCFASAMVSLEEGDEKTASYLFITPLGERGYLTARLGLPAIAAFFATLILLPVFKLTEFSLAAILLLAAGGALQGVIVALLILTLSSNKLEGMAVAKLSTLTVLGAVIPFFIKEPWQYLSFPLPSFWIGKAVCQNRLSAVLAALALSVFWICFLLKRYLGKRQGDKK